MNSIPIEAKPYLLGTAIMAVFFVAALVRVWLLRRQETRLIKRQKDLEDQLAAQEREVTVIRQDALAWRSEMHRQFDATRAMMTEQMMLERKRFDDLLERSRQREFEQQAALDVARQMCAELPAAKARVMQLEQALEIDGGEGLVAGSPEEPAVTPMPDLGGQPPNGAAIEPPSIQPLSASGGGNAGEVEGLEERLAKLQQQNATLQQALAAARVRSKLRLRASTRP